MASSATFKEMRAAQQVSASLRSTILSSSAAVKAWKSPVRHMVHEFGDEAFALLMLLIEGHSLKTYGASFAEAICGLQRRPVDDSLHCKTHPLLTRRQRMLSLVFLVGLPYVKSKLQSIYDVHKEEVPQKTGVERPLPVNVPERASVEASSAEQYTPWIQFKKQTTPLFVCLYPWIHTIVEGVSFGYQFLYFLNATKFFSPALHFMKLHVSPLPAQETMNLNLQIAKQRSRDKMRFSVVPPYLQFVQKAFLKIVYTILDCTQAGIIAALFASTLGEWWREEIRKRLRAPAYPPPFPPPPPKGLSLPSNKCLCPLCSQPRVEPALCVPCGCLFCKRCIHDHVEQHGECPITHVPTKVDQIRVLQGSQKGDGEDLEKAPR